MAFPPGSTHRTAWETDLPALVPGADKKLFFDIAKADLPNQLGSPCGLPVNKRCNMESESRYQIWASFKSLISGS